MDYVLVFMLGMAVATAPAWIWAASKRRPAAAATASEALEAAPIIVLPPAPQAITNNYSYTENYYDNRRVDAKLPPVYTSEAQQPLARRDRRVVRAEQEEW